MVSNSSFGTNVYLSAGVTVINSRIGDFSYVNSNSAVSNADIGKFCSLGQELRIGLGAHPTGYVSTHPAFYANNKAYPTFADKMYFDETGDRITIGNDVWIGYRALIMNGVTISDGAIVAAGAIVTHDVEPYSIVGGVPARHIRYRFDPYMIGELLRLRWWDLDPAELKTNFRLFLSPVDFLEHYSRI